MNAKTAVGNHFSLGLFLLGATIVSFILMLSLSSCDEGISVKEDYPFDVELLPYYTTVQVGEPVEVRCKIVSEGKSSDVFYSLRFFPTKGRGKLSVNEVGGVSLTPNDNYILSTNEEGEFRLYYTPVETGNHKVLLTVLSNKGEESSFEIELNTKA